MNNLEQKNFKIGFIISALLHLILILMFFFGLPAFLEKLPAENIITFEMLPISAISNVTNQDPKKAETKPVQKAQKIKQKTPEPKSKLKVEQSEKTPKKAETKPIIKEPTKVIPPKKEETTKAENILAQKKVITPIKAKKALKKKAEPKNSPQKTVKKEEDAIDAILKNLQQSSDGEEISSHNRSSNNSTDNKKYARGNYDEDSPLSITEKQLIRKQVEDKWRKPAGLNNLDKMKIIIHISLERDGSVIDTMVKDTICPFSSKTTCKLVEESALRAVWKANPIENLLLERYSTWKEFDLEIDPSEL